MKRLVTRNLLAAAVLLSHAGIVQATDIENMLGECRVRAATIFGTDVDDVDVKYECQRTDKTHAVNGSVFVRGTHETFQCSFEPKGYRIEKFIVNNPAR